MPERVEKQDVQATQPLHRLWRDLAEIGEIGGRAKTETLNLHGAVDDLDRLKTRAEKLDRSVDVVHLHARQAAVFVIRIEDVTEHALHGLGGIRVRVQRNLVGMAEAQGPNIVKPEHVVGVSMSIEDGIQPLYPLANGLLAKVGRGIDDHAPLRIFEHDRGPGAAVAGIDGRTHAALAPDGWDSHGGATAQDREDSPHLLLSTGHDDPRLRTRGFGDRIRDLDPGHA